LSLVARNGRKGYGRNMTVGVGEAGAQIDSLAGRHFAAVGHRDQARPWDLDLRDPEIDVAVCLGADPSRDAAEADGFTTSDPDGANDADVACLPVPDDVVPALQIEPRPGAAVILASGYTIAFEADLRSRLGGRADTNQPS
jgi:ketol-acid reductoisomerase